MSLAADLVHQYGYLTVTAGVGLESVGLPLPGETALIVAGAYAGTTHRLSVVLVVVFAATAAIVGDNLGFWIGRRFGTHLQDRLQRSHGRWADRLHDAEGIFDRHAFSIVVLGRFVSVLRTYIAFLSGHSAMRWCRFAMLNAIGCILWASTVGVAAAALGSSASGLFELVAGGLLVVVVGSSFLHHQLRRRGTPSPDHRSTAKQGANV